MRTFDFEKMFIFWSLKSAVRAKPYIHQQVDSGTIFKVKLMNGINYRPFEAVYKKELDGSYKMLYVEIKSTRVSHEVTGQISYYIDVDTLYDDEAWEELDSV